MRCRIADGEVFAGLKEKKIGVAHTSPFFCEVSGQVVQIFHHLCVVVARTT